MFRFQNNNNIVAWNLTIAISIRALQIGNWLGNFQRGCVSTEPYESCVRPAVLAAVTKQGDGFLLIRVSTWPRADE
jgi:hypothetical protein